MLSKDIERCTWHAFCNGRTRSLRTSGCQNFTKTSGVHHHHVNQWLLKMKIMGLQEKPAAIRYAQAIAAVDGSNKSWGLHTCSPDFHDYPVFLLFATWSQKFFAIWQFTLSLISISEFHLARCRFGSRQKLSRSLFWPFNWTPMSWSGLLECSRANAPAAPNTSLFQRKNRILRTLAVVLSSLQSLLNWPTKSNIHQKNNWCWKNVWVDRFNQLFWHCK
jgi:hypothetical protein